VFDELEGETIDYHTDSNKDGISDYYTQLLCDGKLTTGTGVPIFAGYRFEDIQASDDYDNDGLKNGEEIVVTEGKGKTYLKIKSSPTRKDTDNDGISDNEDTAPLKKGLSGGVIGELTIVSCHPNDSGFTGGHAWLTYKSFVNDEIDVSGLLNGYIYSSKGFVPRKVDSYSINRNGYLAIGNAGTEGTSRCFKHNFGLMWRNII